MNANSKWLKFFGELGPSKHVLVCFPYAGGGASIFEAWQTLLGEEFCVCAVQLPGREDRIGEDFPTDIYVASSTIASELRPHVNREFHFFGHSFGALLAFLVVRELRAAGCKEPRVFFASAKVAPHLGEHAKIHKLADDELSRKLTEYGGTPEEVLQNEDLMAMVLPRIRADIGLGERYSYSVQSPLASDIVVYGAEHDALAPIKGLVQWQEHTANQFRIKLFDSNHFFIHSLTEELIENMRSYIKS